MTTFNRLDTVEEVFPAVREARPPRLYLAVDGPRPDRRGEAEKVAAVRDFLSRSVDWDCEVKTLFRETNLGCGRAMSEAIDWFFQHESAGIILEDDCLPSPSFFRFCDAMIERYAGDSRVMHISGSCLADLGDPGFSYFFSLYPQVWGWATWREAWEAFSLQRDDLDAEIDSTLARFTSEDQRHYWDTVLRRYFAGEIDTWDYPWSYSLWREGGVAIYPTANLVKNIGFKNDATHTKSWKDFRGLGNRDLAPLNEITDPPSDEVDHDLDAEVFKQSYMTPSKPVRALKIVKRLLATR